MIRRIVFAAFVLALLATVSGQAEEWKGKIGFGARGVGLAPMFEGSDFDQFGSTYEPFQMAWNGGGELRYGLTKRLALAAGYAWMNTYDDSTATGDRTFSTRNPDHAFSHLRGQLYWLTASYHFNIEKKLQPFVMGGFGIDHWRLRQRAGSDTHKVTDLGLKLGGGLEYWLLSWVTVDAHLRFTYELANLDTDMPEGFYGSGDWSEWATRPFHAYLEPAVGLTLYLGGGAPDEDKDGVKDPDDQCPGTPQGATVDDKGCPLDSDGDGVYDGLDQCPDTQRGVLVDAVGCPLDTDGDGVFDSFDQCPNTPAGVAVDANGCPPDADRDGVADHIDQCPDTPLGATVDANGCPKDADGDGVFDGLDKCPDTPAGTPVDARGCSQVDDTDADGVPNDRDDCPGTPIGVEVNERGCPRVERIEHTITLSGNVSFASGKFDLTDAGKAALDSDVVQRMIAYPETKIRVNGFTDSQGSEAANLTLSQNRANAVVQYLVSKGIDATRMTAQGFGEDPGHFVGDNNTPEGRQLNRRVEITLAE